MDNRMHEQEEQGLSAWHPRESEIPTQQHPRVWVLDNSPQQLALTKHVLSPLFAVTTFLNSAGLLQALFVEPPDVLILDLRLVELSGLDVLRIVRQSYDEVMLPVLMVSASGEQGADVLQALQAGANDFVIKPLARAELRARVSTLARIRRLHARARHAEQLCALSRERERQTREEAEAQRSSMYQVLMQAPTGICLLHGREHVVQFANPLFCQLLARTDLAGKPASEVFPEALLTVLVRVELTGRRFDGRETPVPVAQRGAGSTLDELYFDLVFQPMRSARGEVESIMVLLADVSARVVARRDELRASVEAARLAELISAERNLLTAVLDHTPVGIVVADVSGKIVLANRRAELELKQTATEADGVDPLTWPALESAGAPLDVESYPVAQALRGKQVRGEELGYRFADGSENTLQVSYGPVSDGEGRVSAAVVVFQDVTARRNAELEAHKRAEFEKQLIGIVSHDLRTPIGAINLGASLLAADRSLTELQRRIVTRVASSAERSSRMVRDLLDFTAVRLGNGLPIVPAEIELHELTRKVIAETLLANPGRQIDVRQSGDARGSWDPDRIAQVVSNLASNALQYSPRNTSASIQTHGDEQHVSLLVHNGGSPIPDDLLPRLFLPMQRGNNASDPARRSVGLGLFIVDGIVRAHRGSIEVRSTLAEGTTFVVRLPRASALAAS